MIRMTGHTTVAEVVALSRPDSLVQVDPAIRAVITDAATGADEIGRRIPTYGRSIGVGANRQIEVDLADTEHGLRLLQSHATDAGAPLPGFRPTTVIARSVTTSPPRSCSSPSCPAAASPSGSTCRAANTGCDARHAAIRPVLACGCAIRPVFAPGPS